MRVLLVEDDAMIGRSLTRALHEQGILADWALDAEEAAEAWRTRRHVVVLLDLGLPDRSGVDLLRTIRNDKIDTPVLVITARADVESRVDILDLGADDYIEKPFGTSELLARIRTAIRHTRTPLDNNEIAQSGKFTVKDLTIDYDKHHVLIGDQDVHLTLNEFKIVALLGKYAGKVLTYDYLIKQIWGPKAKADNQILRVNMANIRRKIEKNPASPEYIFTEIGVGYRMLENDA